MGTFSISNDIAELSRTGWPTIMFLHNVGLSSVNLATTRNTTAASLSLAPNSSIQWDPNRPLFAWCDVGGVSSLIVSDNSGLMIPQVSEARDYGWVSQLLNYNDTYNYGWKVGNAAGIEIRGFVVGAPTAPLPGFKCHVSGGISGGFLFTRHYTAFYLRGPVHFPEVYITAYNGAVGQSGTVWFNARTYSNAPTYEWCASTSSGDPANPIDLEQSQIKSLTAASGASVDVTIPQWIGDSELNIFTPLSIANSRLFIQPVEASSYVISEGTVGPLGATIGAALNVIKFRWASINGAASLHFLNGEAAARSLYYTYRRVHL